jgi:hypothetical protein
MGSLPGEEHIAAAGALFYKIEGQKHRVTRKATPGTVASEIGFGLKHF